MTEGKMHVDEVEINVSLVRSLLAAQFPDWADLPIKSVKSAGTDNALYRLGHDMVVRLPRIHWAIGQVEKEHYWLPRFSPFLPLTIPTPLAKGEPGQGYPWQWSVYRWLDGQGAAIECIDDLCQAAVEVAQFVIALQQIDTTNGPSAFENNLRGVPLAMKDKVTRKAISAMNDMIDFDSAMGVWEAALQAPDWDRAPVWFHGDLLPGNLLVERGQIRAVIDFAGLGVGDPACDMMIAWGLFSGQSRDVFRSALGVDDATWMRGRGQALSQAVIFIPYYLNTNPIGVGNARRMIDEVLADHLESKKW